LERYICIHGHFYQPPRENAWLESIERQDSAYPYHDWNERITDECYAPNTASRMLDGEDYITEIVNNYANISFNFGPTLLSWLEVNSKETYNSILEADKLSLQKFSGHGSALAQAYNHMIMPLANRRDKYTQVLWGITDFEKRFNRKPEGMWLPETAVDLETLDILAECEIKFTILAPHQAKKIRKIGSDTWTELSNSSIDPTTVYEARLPSGRKIAIFFYNGPISRSIAFEDLLTNGETFAERLINAYSESSTWPQLVHIATDGETYGHHHRFGDMALAFALHYIETKGLAHITNYGEYLEKHAPAYEVEIAENTSWSCIHGIERWRSNCGCNAGRNPKWNQKWRAPLREALDWLRDTLAPKYEEKAKGLLKDPWDARNQYIRVVLNRSTEYVQKFLQQHQSHELTKEDNITALKLLELQRHTLLMYTSCGWFFDELSGIETVQIIQYAGRALQLAQEIFGDSLEISFLEKLEIAKSNVKEHSDGRRIYEKFVQPAILDLTKVIAHYAVSSLFEEYSDQATVYSYRIDREDHHTSECGQAKLITGKANVTSIVTLESKHISFGVLHFGGHNINAGVREYQGEELYQTMLKELTRTFLGADFAESVRMLDKHFGTSTYSLRSLFRDEQHKVLDNILQSSLSEIETAYYQVYEHHYPPMRFLAELGYPIPKSYQSAATLILNSGLRQSLSNEPLDSERISSLLNEVQTWQVELDVDGLSYQLQQSLERMMTSLLSSPMDCNLLKELLSATRLALSTPFSVDLWKVQNLYHKLLGSVYPELKKKTEEGDTKAREWTDCFIPLGQQLSIRVS
jgi:alpha-amylase/alpha-mannosidase (GH57 family)